MEKLSQTYLDPRSRALYANSHLLSKSLHLLSFSPPPPSSLQNFTSALLDFVWGRKYHSVPRSVVFKRVKMGGLGLIDPEEIDKANSLRFLSSLFSQAEFPWIDIAFSSFASASHSQFSIPALSPSSPTPPSFRTACGPGYGAFRLSDRETAAGIGRARKDWQEEVDARTELRQLFPPAREVGHPVLQLPSPSLPSTPSFPFLSLSPPFSTSTARHALSALSSISPLSTAISSLSSTRLDETALKKLWRWVQRRPATAREADTHWRLLHGAIAARARLHFLGHAESAACVYCGLKDDVGHVFFSCAFSLSFWDEYRTLLISSLSPSFKPAAFNAQEILLGLPVLTAAAEKEHPPTLRAVGAVALQLLHDTRLSRIRSSSLTSTSPSPPDRALRAVGILSARLG
ncbi:hypothetical protein JCM8547_001068 [Rhodosporidiobolus lusitaniae]